MIRIANINDAINQRIFKNRDVVILGAGKDGKNACETLLISNIVVKCFVDSDKFKHGKSYFGIPVVSNNDVVIKISDIVLLCIGAFTFLKEEGILEHKFIKSIGIISSQLVLLDRSMKIFEVLKDVSEKNDIDLEGPVINFFDVKMPNYLKMCDEVRRTFLLECCDLVLPTLFDEWSVVDEGPYEMENVYLNRDGEETIIDCGANIGIFSAISASIPGNIVYAIEPIPASRSVLRKVCCLYPNVKIFPIALSEQLGVGYMSNSSNLGQNRLVTLETDSSIEVVVQTVDFFVYENNIEHVDFIKADIEGAERYMLNGAKETLREHQPKLGICTYHLDDDPDVLEEIIKKANPSYQVIQKKNKLYAYV